MTSYLNILKLSLPLAIGMVNNAVMQFTDRAFLSHESMASLEAVLPASILAFIILGFFQSVVAYSGTFVAQYHGAGNTAMCRRSYRAGIVLAILSGLTMVLALPLGDWTFNTFSNGADVIQRQKTYFDICTLGGIFLYGQMAAQAYLTGLGRTRVILWVNIIGNLINIAIDPIVIFGLGPCPKLGIAGAAYATVFATAVQWAALSAIAARVKNDAKSDSVKSPCLPMMPLVARILRYGVPSGAYSVLNSLSFTIFVFFTARVGHVEAAVSNAVFSISYVLFAPMEGFSLGAATLVGQCRGRGDEAAAMKAGLKTMLLGVAFVAIASALAVAFRHPLIALYAPDDMIAAARFHSMGSTLFLLMATWQVFDAADIIISGALKGAGDTHFVMWWMLFTAFILWLPLVWIVSRVHNTMPALWATIIAYAIVICIGSLVRWLMGGWSKNRIIEREK